MSKADKCPSRSNVSREVNLRVGGDRSKEIQIRIHTSDSLALSAVGPGTLPLRIDESVGNFISGTPLATGFFPLTKPGEPRLDGYTMPGIDLMFRWDFRPAGR